MRRSCNHIHTSTRRMDLTAPAMSTNEAKEEKRNTHSHKLLFEIEPYLRRTTRTPTTASAINWWSRARCRELGNKLQIDDDDVVDDVENDDNTKKPIMNYELLVCVQQRTVAFCVLLWRVCMHETLRGNNLSMYVFFCAHNLFAGAWWQSTAFCKSDVKHCEKQDHLKEKAKMNELQSVIPNTRLEKFPAMCTNRRRNN